MGLSTANPTKGTNLRGQIEPKRRFSQIFADFCRFAFSEKNKAFPKDPAVLKIIRRINSLSPY